MKKFELSARVDSKKVFIIQSSQLEGRLDVDFYKPEILALEYKVRSKASGKLSKYIAKIASGSTPSKTEEHKYYTTSELGIPFLRVQNLCVNGEISFTGLKYINEETHEGLLKRSQVSGGDLLVKITGVGRMAIASVAPENFIANTNQHMVVIKPKNISSKYLAQYLNLDLVEKLASRRSTGGTRPALDYPALKSIPIIENIDFSKLNDAYVEQKRILKEANEKLVSIDKYLLDKLGVVGLNESVSTLNDRIFKMNKSKLQSNRWDVSYYADNYFDSLEKSKFPIVKLKNIILENPIYGASAEAVDFDSNNSVRYLRITDIDELGRLKSSNPKSVKDYSDRHKVFFNDIFFARSGSVGKCYIHKLNNTKFIFAGYLIKFKIDPNICLPDYLFYYAYSSIYLKWVEKIQRPGVQANINATEYKDLPIILPSIDVQQEIVDYISKVRDEAKTLEDEANLVLENAKQEIEKMILGETV